MVGLILDAAVFHVTADEYARAVRMEVTPSAVELTQDASQVVFRRCDVDCIPAHTTDSYNSDEAPLYIIRGINAAGDDAIEVSGPQWRAIMAALRHV